MYLTFDEYQEFGGTLEETAFDSLAFEAKTIIDWWTYDRLQNESEYSEAVKRCMYKLIDILSLRKQAQTLDNQIDDDGNVKKSGIMQESNDGVSTTYNLLSASEAIDMADEEFKTTIRMYLSNVRNSLGRKVLYRGLYPGE